MANAAENQASNSFANNFAQQLARVLSTAQAKEWTISLLEAAPDKLPPVQSPVPYRFRFGERLKGACYTIFSNADVSVLGGGQQPAAAAKDADMVADAEALVEEPSAALLSLLRKVAEALPETLAGLHGTVTAVVERAEGLDPLAVHRLELEATERSGASAMILLYFDPALLASMAPVSQASTPSADTSVVANSVAQNSMVQANLGLVMDVELSCTLRFGQRQLSLREILDLASGSVVELDRQVDEPVELILDGRVIARGEAVIIDGNYGLRVTQVLHTIAY